MLYVTNCCGDLFARNPRNAASAAQGRSLGKTLRTPAAHRATAVDAPTWANALLVSFDETFKFSSVNLLAAWTTKMCREYIADNDVLVNPLVREGYPSIKALRAQPNLPG